MPFSFIRRSLRGNVSPLDRPNWLGLNTPVHLLGERRCPMTDNLKDVLGWGSPIGLAIFFIAIGILVRLTAWGRGKKD